MSDLVEGYLGTSENRKKSRMPARLDFWQSFTGGFLGLFMWVHMFFVATILVSQDFFYACVKFLEADFIFGGREPLVTSFFALCVLVIFIAHAGLGMRKFPINWKQFQVMRAHSAYMNHEDTKLWFIQAITGFVMFFFGSAHLVIIMTNSEAIGPFASADRMWTENMWLIYVVLLLAVEFHGTIGLYRLCVKWGWFDGENPKETRIKLKKIKKALTVFFLVLGFITMAAYVKIGINHADKAGERYHESAQIMHIDYIKPEIKGVA